MSCRSETLPQYKIYRCIDLRELNTSEWGEAESQEWDYFATRIQEIEPFHLAGDRIGNFDNKRKRLYGRLAVLDLLRAVWGGFHFSDFCIKKRGSDHFPRFDFSRLLTQSGIFLWPKRPTKSSFMESWLGLWYGGGCWAVFFTFEPFLERLGIISSTLEQYCRSELCTVRL